MYLPLFISFIDIYLVFDSSLFYFSFNTKLFISFFFFFSFSTLILVFYNDVWSCTDSGKTWINVTTTAPWSVRGFFGSLVYNSSIIVMGGGKDSSK